MTNGNKLFINYSCSDPDVGKQDSEDLDVCKFFLRGRCHFGDRCRLSHRLVCLCRGIIVLST